MADRPFKYPSASDLDPNVIDLLFRALEPKLTDLIDQRQQRRQVWGPTFKQEGIRIIPIGDADYEFTSTDYGKRTLIITGTLTASRRLQLPILSGAWWIVRNDTSQDLKMVAGVGGTAGPIIPPGETAACYTDGVSVWTFPTFITGTAGGAMRLDEILNPTADTNLGIGNFSVIFSFSGAETEDCFLLQTASNAAGGGPILHVKSQGTTSNKIPLWVDANTVVPALIVDSDGTVGVNTLSPLANFHVSGTIRFDLGGDVYGDMYYRTSPDGLVGPIPFVNAANQMLSTVETAPSSGIFRPAWVTATVGTGGAPVGFGSELQARNSATPSQFKAITDSATAGADVTLAGVVRVTLPGANANSSIVKIESTGIDPKITFDKYTNDANPIFLVFNRAAAAGLGAPADITIADTHMGMVLFRGRRAGNFINFGYLQSKYETAADMVTEMGAGNPDAVNASKVRVTQSATSASVSLHSGSFGNFFQVETFGFKFSHGTVGSLYYRDSSGYFINLDIDTTGTPPVDLGKVLTVTDIGGGVLQPRWQPATGGPGGFPPQGADGTLQYRANASAFGTVVNSSVSGATSNITLGGDLLLKQITSFNQTVFLSAISTHPTITLTKYVTGTSAQALTFQRARGTSGSGGAVAAGDHIGKVEFQGGTGGASFSVRGYLDSSIQSDGSVLELGAGVMGGARVRINDNGAGLSGVAIYGSPTVSFQVQWAGFIFSSGGWGCLYHRDSSGYFVPTATPPPFVTLQAQDRIAFWDASAGVVKWLSVGANLTIDGATDTLSASSGPGGGPTLNGTDQFILYRQNSTTMNTVSGFTVSGTGPNLTMGGNLTFSVGGSLVLFDRPGDTTTNVELGRINFQGKRPSASADIWGYVRSYWSTSFGKVTEIGGPLGNTRLAIENSASNTDTMSMYVAGGRFWQIQQTGGFRISIGNVGAIYYQADVGGTTFFTALEATSGINGDILTLDNASGNLLPTWKSPTLTGGIANTGGVTNSVQYKLTGTTMGGIATSTAGGVLMVTGAANSVAQFSTTFNPGVRYSFAPDNTRAGLNVGQNLSLAAGSNPSTATVGDIYYNKFAERFRFYQGSPNGWVELGGTGSGSPPTGAETSIQTKSGTSFVGIPGTAFGTGILDLGDASNGLRTRMQSTSALGLMPTLNVDYTLTGAGTVDDAYSQRLYFHNNHTGPISGGNGRHGLTVVWEVNANSVTTANGDQAIEVYASSLTGLTLSSYNFQAIVVDATHFVTPINSFYGLRIKGFVTTTGTSKWAIYTESGSGNVAFNVGSDLSQAALVGHLCIPAMVGGNPSAGFNPPAGTVGLVYDKTNHRLWVNSGGTWRSTAILT